MSDLIPLYTKHQTAAGRTERTREVRANMLRALHAALPFGLAYASTEHLDQWLATPHWTRGTRAAYASHIRCFYAWATRAGILDGDPTIDMARPSAPQWLPNPLTDTELAAVLADPDPRWRLIGTLGAFAGLRACEMCRLDRADVTDSTLRVLGKGDTYGIVPTHHLVWAAVRDLPPGHVVTNAAGKPLSPKKLSAWARHHYDRRGLTEVRLHRMRHWFGTALLEAGVDLRTVQELMRHKSIISTQGYTLVTSARRAAAVAGLAMPKPKPPPLTQRVEDPNRDGEDDGEDAGADH